MNFKRKLQFQNICLIFKQNYFISITVNNKNKKALSLKKKLHGYFKSNNNK